MKDFVELLLVYIENCFYNLSIKAIETVKWGRNKTWWKIQLSLCRLYLFHSPFNIMKKYAKDSNDFIYGETPILTINEILNDIDVNSDDIFVDLGCGRGLAVLGAFLTKNIRCYGMDIVETFVDNGSKIAEWLQTDKIKFTRGDITEKYLNQGNIFFIAGTTFDEETMAKLTKNLSSLQGKIKIISLSQEIKAQGFRTVMEKKYRFSWGYTKVYIQEKSS